MDTVHDSQAFISHHLNMLERPSTPGRISIQQSGGDEESSLMVLLFCCFISK